MRTKISSLLIGLGVIVIIGGTIYYYLPYSSIRSLFTPASVNPCKTSSGEKIEILLENRSCQTHITLEPDQLSKWIVTPVGSTVRIDRDFDSKIRFPGSDWMERPNNSFKDHGIKRGIFQIQNLGEKKGDVVITIER